LRNSENVEQSNIYFSSSVSVRLGECIRRPFEISIQNLRGWLGNLRSQVIGTIVTPGAAPQAPLGSKNGCSQCPRSAGTPDWGSTGSQNPFRRKKVGTNSQVSEAMLGGQVGPFSVGFGPIDTKPFRGGQAQCLEPVSGCGHRWTCHERLRESKTCILRPFFER